MRRSAGTWHPKYAGLVVAGVGFVLTRYTVLDSVRDGETVARFLVGQAPFLLLGLGLAAFGVALTVSTYTPRQVRVVAAWCLLGVAAMAAILGLTRADTLLFDGSAAAVESGELVANVLIGGAVGGVLVGVRSAENRRQRHELAHQTDRLTVLNRILRHEVLNKLNVIRGYAALGVPGQERVTDLGAIRRSADRIEVAMEDVTPLTRSPRRGAGLEPVRLDRALDTTVAATREAYPHADVRIRGELPAVTVLADDHLAAVLGHVLDNAVAHNDAPDPRVSVEVGVRHASVAVCVSDDGPGLPADQRSLLAAGDLPEYDDPTTGFGLAVSQLLVDLYGGDLRVASDAAGERGTTLTLEFARPADGGGGTPVTAAAGYGVSTTELLDVTASAVVAGMVMGVVLQALFGSIAIIGVLYGVASASVAWTTHLFHSVVFGFVFAAAVRRWRFGPGWRRVARCSAAGAAYGLVLWLLASGFVMPLWLRAVGTPAAVPSLSAVNLFGHLIWGAVLGGLYVRLRGRRAG